MTISTTCPRCSATIDPDAVEQHHERCFVAGDRVRWWPYNYADNPNAQYIDGRVAKTAPLMIEVVAARNFGLYDSLGAIVPGGVVDPSISPGTIRHIQRPGQAANEQRRWVHERNGILYFGDVKLTNGPSIAAIDHSLSPHASDAQIKAMLEAQGGKVSWSDDPAPTLYDGLSAMECYAKWGRNRAAVECGVSPLYDLTPNQIAAGRRAYQMDALNEHADELRTRISAAKERERLTVCVPIDSEDLPWR